MQEKQQAGKKGKAVGRGFFIALTLCILAVGGMATSHFTETLRTQEQNSAFTTVSSQTTTSASPVAVTLPTTASTTATTTVLATTTTEPPRASVVWPLGNTVAAPFSETPVYSETMEDYRPHSGVDLAGEDGDTVVALTDGTVTGFEQDVLWGGSLTVSRSDGTQAIYRGVKAGVKEGDAVQAGDPVGVLTGVPCEQAGGMHLHLELLMDGKPADPMTLLRTVSGEAE